jgi:DNA-binding protein H-NS
MSVQVKRQKTVQQLLKLIQFFQDVEQARQSQSEALSEAAEKNKQARIYFIFCILELTL